MDRLKLFKELSEVPGVPGYEDEVRKVIRGFAPLGTKIVEDKLGSIILEKKGSSDSPKIMFPAHMDEIGFMVRNVDKNGFIRFLPLGGWWDQVIVSQRVVVQSKKGPLLGVVGSKPPHLMPAEERDKMVKKKDMYIDIGATSKEDAMEMGVSIGDSITPYSPFTTLNKDHLFLGKAWDDRLGCCLFLELMEELKDQPHPNTIYGAGTVQEEVGLRGAYTSVRVVNPDVAIVLEVAIAGDTPGIKEEECQVAMGKGPSLLVYDARMIPNLKLKNLVVETAAKENIPLQLDAMDGGATDGGIIHLHEKGVPTVVLGVPTRYIHGHQGFFNLSDYEHALKLIKALTMKLDKETVDSLTK
ncbi:MAG: putative aminopeptidase YsdC [candidate division WS2 bacterium]|uniref:Aminopeptidase YsdC n=1 Tax=Psychracetigena formicireducens TaxID=2986056 RepID=A0A9E2F7U1_PSYF1|nr:putative aminopeptidase YsdC [Candidatus Psychracetigena formicireducens]MBT9145963.1 putative aminopeptidase YsdC [Candidatus Psychracetigena formicireducens]